ncbi:putative Pachytene checkpoint protein 2 like protein [Blattamonas nauphoetae]|uniref:Pachytene checkpoint protein 2 like protein n=1 Tax=Blattamonas nauphoetae TaxID=2049346 RepID=A0ABQ9XTF0_9EUKA|nr:putative Pachytene checkpoint protein 2 like protein [Blattamonas nauphoetae]
MNQSEHQIPITVEVRLKEGFIGSVPGIRAEVLSFISNTCPILRSGFVDISGNKSLLNAVVSVRIEDLEEVLPNTDFLVLWQAKLMILIYRCDEEGFIDDSEGGDDDTPSCMQWMLPNRTFEGLWENCNRLILLHGPPGTGKTALCRSLAQKLAISVSERYANGGVLMEINAHSLFSKWFSESGKLVLRMFQHIHEIIEDEQTFVVLLIDEVESLSASRTSAMSGNEPSDAIRVVNALLTQIDALKTKSNVIVLTTSNITSAIDTAFIDRADIKQLISNPTHHARYIILSSCLLELVRKGIVTPSTSPQEQPYSLLSFHDAMNSQSKQELDEPTIVSNFLLKIAELADGFSGRALRKLPLLAHTNSLMQTFSPTIPILDYLSSLDETVRKELSDRQTLSSPAST